MRPDLDGDQTIAKVSKPALEVWSPLSYCPRSSLPVEVLAWLAGRLAHLTPPRPPGRGGTPPLALEVRLDAVAAVLLDGLSYRRAGRMVGISKTEVGDSLDLVLGELGALGFGQPGGSFVTTLDDLRALLAEMAQSGEAVVVDGLATPGATPRRLGQPEGAVRRQAACPHRPGSGGVDRLGGPAVVRRGLARQLPRAAVAGAVGAWGRAGWRHRRRSPRPRVPGMARPREHWHAPVGDRRTKDRLTDEQRAFNRLQAGLRALVEQSIAHLANDWALRRWRGLLYRLRDVYRAAGALICLGRWLHRVPT